MTPSTCRPRRSRIQTFIRGLKLFLSPDGKSAQYIITHKGDPATPEGISHIDPIMQAASEAVKGTPLESANLYLGGTAATYKDMRDGSMYDLMIAVTASICLIFMVMLGLTRSLVAAAVIVGTVTVSLASSFGLSVLLWQHLLHMPLNWLVLPMAIVIMLAVGSDYNLLLVSRFQEEIHAGLKTGIIRSMGGTGRVVTAAGLVFAFTMGSMRQQRPTHRRPNRLHHHARTALRHARRAVLHDAGHRGAARTLVLVATTSTHPRRPTAGR